MNAFHPLRFKPTFREYIWGGRRLGERLNKPIGAGEHYAESWEIVDHGEDQSIIAFGPYTDWPLRQFVLEHPRELFGQHPDFERFPLLFKFLDASRKLSVQVHPNDEQGKQLEPPDLGKTEAWVIINADDDSELYAGLEPGCDREALAKAVAQGHIEQCLHSLKPQNGDCLFIPAGLVHALGSGLLVAEIQQSSDTTFRLFDWNRVGTDGKPRPLHMEQALKTIDYRLGPAQPQIPEKTSHPDCSRLVACDKFVLDRWQSQATVQVGGDDRFHIIAVLEGSLVVTNDPAEQPLGLGQTMLIPAASETCELQPQTPSVWLDMYLPTAAELLGI